VPIGHRKIAVITCSMASHLNSVSSYISHTGYSSSPSSKVCAFRKELHSPDADLRRDHSGRRNEYPE
jgi:hypothetical protein